MNYFNYTELNDKSLCLNEKRINFEKLNGRYNLKIRKELKEPIKI